MTAEHSTDPALPTTLPDFNHAAILVVGDIMLDRYWFGDTSRVSPEAPVPIAAIRRTNHRLGGAGNVALNLAALGATVTLLSMVGCDEAADLLEQQLTQASIKHHLIQRPDITTVVKLRVISRQQQLLRLDFEDTPAYNADYEQQLHATFQTLLHHIQLVILSDYNKGTLVNTQALITVARAQGIPVLVDPKGTDFSRYRHASLLTPNLKEFEGIVGSAHTEAELVTKGRVLLKEHDISTLLVTQGEKGMTLITHDHVTHLPAYAHEVLDVTGAGDTVISTFGASLAAGADAITAMTLANLAASISISKLGAAVVTTDELQAAINSKTLPVNGIVSEAELLVAINKARAQGKKIVFTNGCFDVLHAGHVLYLSLAKQLGDYLVVAVNTDDSVRAIKGPDRPFNHENHRMAVLSALRHVDWIVPFADPTPERLLHLIKPDFLVKGGDYTKDQIVGADVVKQYGGEARIIAGHLPVSSTSLIEKMKKEEIEGI